MTNCILAEFYGSCNYFQEIVEEAKFDISKMDSRWEELFGIPMKEDPEASWEMKECQVEPFFDITLTDTGWGWGVGRRLWYDEYFKVIYSDQGECEDFEEALNQALDAFNNMDSILPMTELEDIDDDFTKIES